MYYVCLSALGIENALKQKENHPYAELRLDLVKPSDEQIKQTLADKSTSYIVTCRPGVFSNQENFDKLVLAANNGADYIDVEIEQGKEYIQKLKSKINNSTCKLIVSYHNFDCTPSIEELKEIVEKADDFGADCIKLACMAKFKEDNAKILSLMDLDYCITAFCMGEVGKISRLACVHCGAPFTYVAPNDNTSTAPGQFKLNEILSIKL